MIEVVALPWVLGSGDHQGQSGLEMSMTREQLLTEIKRRLATAHGDRFRGAVLYGSEARGDAEPDSDIDVLVLLDGPAESWEDIKKSSDALYALMLEIGRTIDAMPVDVRRYQQGDAPLYVQARREGITA